eukprot:COSAG02_NODE_6650_length_3436_cov_3.932673_1_plen_408_part_10
MCCARASADTSTVAAFQEPERPGHPAMRLVFDETPPEKATVATTGAGCEATCTGEDGVLMPVRLCRDGIPDVSPLLDGASFEVSIKNRAEGSDGRKGLAIGVIPRTGATTGAMWDRVWAYSAAGQTWSRGSKKSGVKAFKTGDRVKVVYCANTLQFSVNGTHVTTLTDVTGDVCPVVLLARKDDRVSMQLLNSATSLICVADHIWNPSHHAWAKMNPLHPIFLERELCKTLPAAVSQEEFGEDISEYLLEKHLWGPGLGTDAMDREALKLIGCMYRQLRSRTDSESVIRCNAEARAKKLLRMPKLVMQSARGADGEIQLSVSKRTEWATEEQLAPNDEGLFHWLATAGGVEEPEDPTDLGRVEVTSRPSRCSRGKFQHIFDVYRKQSNVTESAGDEAYVQFELKDVAL